MSYIMFLLTMMVLLTIFNVIMHNFQLLMTLLSLELITLSMVMLVTFIMMNNNSITPSIMIIMLTMSACEASLGLSMMVIMSRKFGNDMMKHVTMSKC
uniref:NADH-ubiquinone oxidoreductase chain 4L n=1 Tax=Pterobdella arugamensis TaxID=3410361 RepID=A0A343B6W8_9ANNE|nr:NADH dehydrogenase subunit 4L [Zeylanicobdella arugamensis]AQT26251.1 NADH dehydrogenase subunit 4L [Zeylanicobdella arugamensis]